MEKKDHLRLQKISSASLWIACPVTAASSIAIRSGHPGLVWVVLQDWGLVVGDLALIGLGYFYWRRWRNHEGLRVHDRVLPNESTISRYRHRRRARDS
jgi:hypothetical protein